jgi:osmotically-inducible protein OsmY
MKTDAQVQQDVLDELKWDPSFNAAQIGVEVRAGAVTLTGHVDSHAQKWEAERAALRVVGVMALAVAIEVKLPGSSQRDDADIARAAENVLLWTVDLPEDRLKVMVEGGWLTLFGHVDWHYQSVAAAQAVSRLMGVRGVSNQITIEPRLAVASVKADIDLALRRRARLETERVHVAVEGADVILSGAVRTWEEKELARHTAWCTPGVLQVIDKLTITG